MATKELTYSDPTDLRDRMPDSDLVELTTEGSEAPADVGSFLDNAVLHAQGVEAELTASEEKVGRIIRGALVHGEGRVNSRVGASYRLPALGPDGTVPSEIENAVMVLAEENIRDRRPRRTRGNNEVADITRRANEVRRWLKAVSKGNAIIARLDATGTEEKAKSSAGSGTANRNSRSFSSGW